MIGTFFLIKCVLAFAGTLLLIFHMGREWEKVTLNGQRMRYITLFGYVVTAATASARQVAENVNVIHIENIMGFLITVVLIATIIESIYEGRHGRVREHY